MKTTEYRPLIPKEKQTFLRMLSLEFDGKANLVAQVPILRIRPRDETLFDLCHEGVECPEKKYRLHPIPSEASYRDKDGVLVFVDLFVNEKGELAEMEIWKGDGSPVLIPFTEAELIVEPRQLPKKLG